MASKMQQLIVFGLVYECVQPQTPVYRESGVALTEVAPGSTKGWGLANQGHQRGCGTLSFDPCLCMQASARS